MSTLDVVVMCRLSFPHGQTPTARRSTRCASQIPISEAKIILLNFLLRLVAAHVGAVALYDFALLKNFL
jgi:hypothetical protein